MDVDESRCDHLVSDVNRARSSSVDSRRDSHNGIAANREIATVPGAGRTIDEHNSNKLANRDRSNPAVICETQSLSWRKYLYLPAATSGKFMRRSRFLNRVSERNGSNAG